PSALARPKDKPGDKAARSKKHSNERKTLLVGAFKGKKSAEVRKSVIRALKQDESYDLVETKDVGAETKDDKAAAVAERESAAAIVIGSVSKEFDLTLTLRSGVDGTLIETVEIEGGSL